VLVPTAPPSGQYSSGIDKEGLKSRITWTENTVDKIGYQQ
jgi:hypothetical protein